MTLKNFEKFINQERVKAEDLVVAAKRVIVNDQDLDSVAKIVGVDVNKLKTLVSKYKATEQ